MMRLTTLTITSLLLLLTSPLHNCYGYIRAISIARLPTSLQLNRIFCDMDELTSSSIGEDFQESLILTIKESDNRCKHIRKILKLDVGDTLKGLNHFSPVDNGLSTLLWIELLRISQIVCRLQLISMAYMWDFCVNRRSDRYWDDRWSSNIRYDQRWRHQNITWTTIEVAMQRKTSCRSNTRFVTKLFDKSIPKVFHSWKLR